MKTFNDFIKSIEESTVVQTFDNQSVPTEGGKKFVNIHPVLQTKNKGSSIDDDKVKVFNRKANRFGKNPKEDETEYNNTNLKNSGQFSSFVKTVNTPVKEDINLDEADDSEYHILINKKTGATVGKYKDIKRARNALDKKDNEYGAYVHHIKSPKSYFDNLKSSAPSITYNEDEDIKVVNNSTKHHKPYAAKLPNGKYQLYVWDDKNQKFVVKGQPRDSKESAMEYLSIVGEDIKNLIKSQINQLEEILSMFDTDGWIV